MYACMNRINIRIYIFTYNLYCRKENKVEQQNSNARARNKIVFNNKLNYFFFVYFLRNLY